MALRELLATFDVNTGAAVAKMRQMEGAIDGAVGKLGGLVDAFFGERLAGGVVEFVKGQIEAGSRINDLSEKLGVGTDELQKFQYAAGLVGVEGESAAQALGFLNKHIGEAVTGNAEAVKTFTGLGISLKDGAGNVREMGDILPELADKFAEMQSSPERTAMAMKLFGKSGAALIPLLKDGSDNMQELSDEFEKLGGGLSDKFIKAADEAGDEVDKLKFSFAGLKSKLAAEALPYVTLAAKKLQDVLAVAHKLGAETTIMRSGMFAMGAVGAAAAVKMAIGFGKLTGVLKSGGGLVENLLGLGKIGLAIALVAILAVAVEDFIGFLNGKDSVIGALFQKFLGAEEAARLTNELRTAWEQIGKVFDDAGPGLTSIGKSLLDIAVKALPFFVTGMAEGLKFTLAMVAAIAGLIDVLIKLPGAIEKGDFSAIGKSIDRTGDAIFGKGGVYGAAAKAPGGVPGASQDVSLPQFTRGGTPPANVAQTNNITQNITGVPDAQAAGNAAKTGTQDALGGELRNAFGAAMTGG